MKRYLIAVAALAAIFPTASAQWKMAGDKIRTEWAETVTPQNVWQEYPRPQMVRSEWKNLNGLWNYAITPAAAVKPAAFDGQILVPFAVESALSGVARAVTENDALWYEREISIPSAWASQRIMLNFGAVDWSADVYVNDILVGSHTGGYAPFSIDITPALNPKKGAVQRLTVRVTDPTDTQKHPIGKQRLTPKGIWYTAVTGIWQTVWIEPVPVENRIVAIRPDCNVFKGELYVDVECAEQDGLVEIDIFDGSDKVASAKSVAGKRAVVILPDAKLWDTENPFLYGMKISLRRNGKVIDEVESYAAMRNVDVRRDATGHKRICLNGKPIFMFGPLDQGWWPDGLYTAPNDEALRSDILRTKEFGFNAVRKHVKVEPARWYYHCDREGMLVWQDMPNGVQGKNNWGRNVKGAGTDDIELTAADKANYYAEWEEVMDALRFFPSIVMWVPFNEAWTQFDTETVADWTKAKDPSRIINSASGGNMRECGDILDMHVYPRPGMPLYESDLVVILGEYGGIGCPVEGHLWWNKRNWGYIQFDDADRVTNEYIDYAKDIKKYIPQGMSAAIYTQATDVEGEVNGLVTYDRKVVKMDAERVKAINKEIINSLK